MGLASAAPLRLAVLGGGAVVSEFHLPGAALCPRVAIVAVADPSAASRARLREVGFTGELLDCGYSEALARLGSLPGGRPDALVIALPNCLHEEAALAALAAGYHVLCEKPLALTEAGCWRIAAAAEAAGRIAALGMVRRLTAAAAALREALAAGLVGAVKGIDIEDGAYYPWLSDSGAFFRPENGGILADMGVHYLDLAADLFGPLQPVRYHDDWRGGCEANAEYHLLAPGGLPVRLRLSRDRTLKNRFQVEGERGRLFLNKDDFAASHWQLADRPAIAGVLRPTAPFADPAWPHDFTSCFAQQWHEFAEAVQGGRAPRCDAAAAAPVIRLIEHAYAGRTRCGPAAFGHPAEDPVGPRLPAGPVVVTGATGFIGSRLVARLADQGVWPVRAPVRGYRRAVEAARFEVEMPRLDLLDAAAVREAVRGARHVFHLAYGTDGDARRVTVEGTRHVVEAAVAAGCESVVVLSTAYVFGRQDTERPVDETWPYAPTGGEYGTSKAAMERWCLGLAGSSRPTRVVVLNPTCVYGGQGKTYTRMPAELAARRQFCWVEGGRGIANHVYVENLIDAVLLAAARPEAHGQRLLINDGFCTWREFLTPLLGEYAAELPSFTAAELAELNRAAPAGPRDLLRVLARAPGLSATVDAMPWLGPLKRLLLRRAPGLRRRLRGATGAARPAAPSRPVPPAWLADLFAPTPTRFSSARAAEVLGWRPRVPFDDAMRATVDWLRAVGVLGEAV
jgi:predicted dehydrogenase/nucleoside-diphosphate-sugar epimerase